MNRAMVRGWLFLSAAVAACAGDGAEQAEVARDTAAAPETTTVDVAHLPVTAKQFGGLRWIEGKWRGQAAGAQPFYEGYLFLNDSTLRTFSYADSSATTPSDSGDIVLRDSAVSTGSHGMQWVVTELDSNRVHFAPARNVRNSFTWVREGKDRWMAYLRTPAAGDKPAGETIYTMDRLVER